MGPPMMNPYMGMPMMPGFGMPMPGFGMPGVPPGFSPPGHSRKPGRKDTSKSEGMTPSDGKEKGKKSGLPQTPSGMSEDASPAAEGSDEVNPNASAAAVPLLQEARKPSP